MKKYLHYIILAGIAVISCNKTETDAPSVPTPDAQLPTVQMTFTGIAETGTKTSLDTESGNVSWVAGDKVKFIYEVDKTPGEAISDGITLNGSHASITASVPATFGESEFTGNSRHLYAVYPSTVAHEYGTNLYVTVPSIQDGSFEKAAIALAKWDKEHPTAALEFKNLCGLLQFTITDDSVRKIVLSSHESIAGKMQISFKEGAPVVVAVNAGENTVTVNVPGAGTYYIGVLPNTLSGLYVALYDGSDNLLGDRITDADVTVVRCQIRKLGTLSPGFGDRYFVKVGGAGTKDGSSWDNAADWAALKTVLAGTAGKNIYIAGGTYPFSSNFGSNGTSDGNISFRVYGGYPSDATGYSIGDRDLTANETIFDGEDNARIWVLQSGTFFIDGISFYRGKRLSTGAADTGSALIVERNGEKVLNVTVKNCIFRENSNEKDGGGAIRIGGSTTPVQLVGCAFENNSATAARGGAIFVATNRSVKIKGCTFTGNTASTQGGAVRIESGGRMEAEDCVFSGNSATTQGGACHVDGGTFIATACEFLSNTATSHGGVIESSNAAVIRLNQCIFMDNASSSNSAADLYIGGTSSMFVNACYFGQSAPDSTPATASPHRTLCGANTNIGFNNCVFSGPFGKSNSMLQLGGNSIIVNSTLYGQISGACVLPGSSDANGCRIINSLVLNNSGTKYSFQVNASKYMQVYNAVYGSVNNSGTFTPSSCVAGKYNAGTLDENAFPDNNPWAQKFLGSAVKLPSGSAIKAYVWDGTCAGLTNASLSEIKTLISGTTGVGAGFLEWLESEELKVNGKEALAVDIRGNARNTTALWPGSYE